MSINHYNSEISNILLKSKNKSEFSINYCKISKDISLLKLNSLLSSKNTLCYN